MNIFQKVDIRNIKTVKMSESNNSNKVEFTQEQLQQITGRIARDCDTHTDSCRIALKDHPINFMDKINTMQRDIWPDTREIKQTLRTLERGNVINITGSWYNPNYYDKDMNRNLNVTSDKETGEVRCATVESIDINHPSVLVTTKSGEKIEIYCITAVNRCSDEV
mgnify:CR=1 FL=1